MGFTTAMNANTTTTEEQQYRSAATTATATANNTTTPIVPTGNDNCKTMIAPTKPNGRHMYRHNPYGFVTLMPESNPEDNNIVGTQESSAATSTSDDALTQSIGTSHRYSYSNNNSITHPSSTTTATTAVVQIPAPRSTAPPHYDDANPVPVLSSYHRPHYGNNGGYRRSSAPNHRYGNNNSNNYQNNNNYNYNSSWNEQAEGYPSVAGGEEGSHPQGTLHTSLIGRIGFTPYPCEAFEVAEPALPKNQLVRMFIGQLPYSVTEMQLAWILHTFGGGANMYHFERITKTDYRRGGVKIPTGCLHFHTEPQQVDTLLKCLNDRLLVDDTGIWVADTVEERNYMSRYCQAMKVDKTRRFQGRPYGNVVTQVATSTFDPDAYPPAHIVPPAQQWE